MATELISSFSSTHAIQNIPPKQKLQRHQLLARAQSQYLEETVCSLRFAARAQKARAATAG